MQRHTISTSGLVMIALLIGAVGCSSMKSSSNRVLQSMTLSHANADAQSSSQGQVQFTATGTFSKAPSPAPVPFAPPYTGTWFSSNLNVATITEPGLATCISGAAGTVNIMATASTNSGTGTKATSTSVSATAKLTCP
jgi:hypothetical protein